MLDRCHSFLRDWQTSLSCWIKDTAQGFGFFLWASVTARMASIPKIIDNFQFIFTSFYFWCLLIEKSRLLYSTKVVLQYGEKTHPPIPISRKKLVIAVICRKNPWDCISIFGQLCTFEHSLRNLPWIYHFSRLTYLNYLVINLKQYLLNRSCFKMDLN